MAEREEVAQLQAPVGDPEPLQHNAPQDVEPTPAQHVDEFLEEDLASVAAASRVSDPMVEAAADHNLRAQREIVESVCTLLTQQPAMSAELLMLRQEDIQKFSVTMTQASAAFRRRYGTRADFS